MVSLIRQGNWGDLPVYRGRVTPDGDKSGDAGRDNHFSRTSNSRSFKRSERIPVIAIGRSPPQEVGSLTARFAARITGHQQVTDAYFLGLAIKEDGVLVTFDRGLTYMAGPEFSRNLLVLESSTP